MTSYDVGQSDTYGAFQFNFRYSLHVSKSRQSDSGPEATFLDQLGEDSFWRGAVPGDEAKGKFHP
ncbi:hypothetical protein [Mesorhizobium sp.]|uniref:hypothetical protein n=1 Tax=Mesorhizobium sp. TaxID=1871066 RepID=UPI000FE38B00|nr:hypothetical protein [Mesorhizobium sp.]RWN99470.1 MAG: hypothetical protein EOS06_18995 [Mesorhizobium sp.]RWO40215.1 MAG: hypothetical protein EOS13_33245 [Mesorhizobium sp.]TIN22747.1 MAG: hypothetical protein E5Y19_31205 [Mesorhizobium sp.]TIN32456.1 MAG: hypothetical protein E5Y13_34250 [Mesorhizobium sp.]TJU83658.1 MAG: hypothetical protein E5Y10_34605 [Mesorhizobium sp.]